MPKKSSFKRYLIILKDGFDFSRAEQRGIVILCVILLLLIGYYFFLSMYYTDKQGDISIENPSIDSFLLQQQHYSDSVRASYRKTYSQKSVYEKKSNKQNFNPFHFCPDTMKLKDWMRLGFSEKQASQIEKYQSKGGKFYKKEDLKKLYCVSESTYSILEPYIHISLPEKRNEKRNEKRGEKKENTNSTPKYTYKLELNEVDSLDLLRVPGIGTKIAAQIISYRTKLGGFIHLDQLKEVAFINEERFVKIEPYFRIDEVNTTKININEANISVLVRHPYIDYYLAKSIVFQRNKSGKYTSLEEMKKTLFIYDELYQKIMPYLTVE